MSSETLRERVAQQVDRMVFGAPQMSGIRASCWKAADAVLALPEIAACEVGHDWIRAALNLPEDAPRRYDFYAQRIEELRAAALLSEAQPGERDRCPSCGGTNVAIVNQWDSGVRWRCSTTRGGAWRGSQCGHHWNASASPLASGEREPGCGRALVPGRCGQSGMLCGECFDLHDANGDIHRAAQPQEAQPVASEAQGGRERDDGRGRCKECGRCLQFPCDCPDDARCACAPPAPEGREREALARRCETLADLYAPDSDTRTTLLAAARALSNASPRETP